MIDPGRFRYLTFDCYGTLVDWETGILSALLPVLERHGVRFEGGALLTRYARLEAAVESGPYRRYRKVLQEVMAGLGEELGFAPDEDDLGALAASLGDWPVYADTAESLLQLRSRFGLAIVSNIDDALLAATARRLPDCFDAVITAEQVRSYKPGRAHFDEALCRLGAPREEVLHVAQSLFHDHVPAQELGFATVWVNRPSRYAGGAATPPAAASPDLEVPDLATLARLLVRQ